MSLLKAILNYDLFKGESDRTEGAYVFEGSPEWGLPLPLRFKNRVDFYQ